MFLVVRLLPQCLVLILQLDIKVKFSVTTQSFFDDSLTYGDNLPSDAQEITSEKYSELFEAVNTNKHVYLSNGVMVISEARPDKYYTWNSESNSWEMTAAAVTQKASDEVAAAENYRSKLISFAKDTISVWQTELLLGTISDDDKASLTEWMAYIKALQVVDTSDPESITWPTEPTIS